MAPEWQLGIPGRANHPSRCRVHNRTYQLRAIRLSRCRCHSLHSNCNRASPAKPQCIEPHNAPMRSAQNMYGAFSAPEPGPIEPCLANSQTNWIRHQSSPEILDIDLGCIQIKMKANVSSAFFIIARSWHTWIGAAARGVTGPVSKTDQEMSCLTRRFQIPI